ncbi:MAG: methyltransferase domain-containing protein [Acidobacteria bacterium]|nr:methyltransferase domain-containing protein [Acidobacteriota bacterium]
MTVGWLEELLACPACGGKLHGDDREYNCRACNRNYPIRFGIPDFRLQPDPFISIANEVDKVTLLTAGGGGSFDELLGRYYSLSPENPPCLHRHYIASMQAAVQRGEALLHKLEDRFPDVGLSTVLDLGCGTAGMTVAGARRYPHVVGVDVALRWLVIGSRRLAENHVQAALVCANAEFLPFRTGCFDAAVADSVLEHVRDSVRTKDEMLRVLRGGGVFFFTTNNRYSLLPEPHVRLWGFGLLPRRWMKVVAWWIRKTPYRARLHSLRELRALFDDCGEVVLPFFQEQELGAHAEQLRKWWERLRKILIVRFLLAGIVPLYFVFGRKTSTD